MFFQVRLCYSTSWPGLFRAVPHASTNSGLMLGPSEVCCSPGDTPAGACCTSLCCSDRLCPAVFRAVASTWTAHTSQSPPSCEILPPPPNLLQEPFPNLPYHIVTVLPLENPHNNLYPRGYLSCSYSSHY